MDKMCVFGYPDLCESLDSAFLTCVITNVEGRTASFKLDSTRKVLNAFWGFARECGFGLGNPFANHSITLRKGDAGWSITATVIDNFDVNCSGVFTATGDIPDDIESMVSFHNREDRPVSFVRGCSVVTGNPFADSIEFTSKSAAKKYAKRHRHELRRERDAWDY